MNLFEKKYLHRKQLLNRFTLFFLLLSALFMSCKKDADNPIPLTEIEAPAFSLNALDGGTINLSDFENKVIVLFFFGNACPSCKAAAPSIESSLVEAFSSRTDYQFLGLDQWNGNSAAVEVFRTATGVTFPLLLNAASVAAEYQTTYDRLVVIDKNGKIVFSGTQLASVDLAAVVQKVELLLGEPVDPNPTDTTQWSGNAPEFTLTSLSGGEVKLSDFANKVVVLFFLGNACPSCKAATPDIESMLVQAFSSRTDYQFLGLDQWNGNATAVEAFKTSTGASFPLLLNASDVAAEYETTYDRLIVIDKNGDIVFKGSQVASGDIGTVKEKIELLLEI